QAAAADVSHRGELLQTRQTLIQLGPADRHIGERLLFVEQFQRGQRGGASKRIATKRMSMEEGTRLRILTQKRIPYPPRRQRCGQRQIAAAETLPCAQEIGLNLLPLASPQLARTPHP